MILMQDVFTYDYRAGIDEHGRPAGLLKATGIRPHLTQRLADRGIKLDPNIFDIDGASRGALPQPVPAAQLTSAPQALLR